MLYGPARICSVQVIYVPLCSCRQYIERLMSHTPGALMADRGWSVLFSYKKEGHKSCLTTPTTNDLLTFILRCENLYKQKKIHILLKKRPPKLIMSSYMLGVTFLGNTKKNYWLKTLLFYFLEKRTLHDDDVTHQASCQLFSYNQEGQKSPAHCTS